MSMSCLLLRNLCIETRSIRGCLAIGTSLNPTSYFLKISQVSTRSGRIRNLTMSSSAGVQKRPVGRRYIVACDGK